LFKKDCKAAVPVVVLLSALVDSAVAAAPVALAASVDEPGLLPLALPPVKALISVLNAVLSWDKLLEERPVDPVDELSS
jgi:hypothetical protein